MYTGPGVLYPPYGASLFTPAHFTWPVTSDASLNHRPRRCDYEPSFAKRAWSFAAAGRPTTQEKHDIF